MQEIMENSLLVLDLNIFQMKFLEDLRQYWKTFWNERRVLVFIWMQEVKVCIGTGVLIEWMKNDHVNICSEKGLLQSNLFLA